MKRKKGTSKLTNCKCKYEDHNKRDECLNYLAGCCIIAVNHREDCPFNAINHPSHYNEHPSGVECIDIVQHFNFNVGNAIKYLWRAGLKGNRENKACKKQDLEKAKWFIEREIGRVSK